MEMRHDTADGQLPRLLTGLGPAPIFMYLVLVMQFRGFLQPLTMIASLPLELAGVFTALAPHQSFPTVSILGIIVLTGMDITAGGPRRIGPPDHALPGLNPPRRSAARACPDRLRPILMTSMISLIVLLPVAIAPKTAWTPISAARHHRRWRSAEKVAKKVARKTAKKKAAKKR